MTIDDKINNIRLSGYMIMVIPYSEKEEEWQDEKKLMQIVPRKHWLSLNNIFVDHGKTICVPVSPFCSKCPVYKYCKRINVKKIR